MAHREDIKAYLGKIDLTGKKVLDWGRGTKPVTNYCKGKPEKYFGIDKLDHVGADMVADIGKPSIVFTTEENDSKGTTGHIGVYYDTAFCMEVLEHVIDTEQLLKNIYENLKEGGIAYFSVPFMFRIHSEEDYWRFTDQGLHLILEKVGFEVAEILPTFNSEGWLAKAIKR